MQNATHVTLCRYAKHIMYELCKDLQLPVLVTNKQREEQDL